MCLRLHHYGEEVATTVLLHSPLTKGNVLLLLDGLIEGLLEELLDDLHEGLLDRLFEGLLDWLLEF